jgi:gamma-glutamyl-gamma-aminobutyrate hydrolase PuuD
MGNASRRARLAVAQAKKDAKAKGSPQPEPEVKNAILLAPPKKTHGVQIFRDCTVDFPQLYLDVWISEPTSELMLGEMFGRAACRKAKTLDKADLVVFTGGADVSPELYGEKLTDAHPKTRFNKSRDNRDMQLYADALQMRIPMVGICRGAQFLHVMNGGKLYQDVDGHQTSHSIRTADNLTIDAVTSTHHQMVMSNDRMVVLATARQSTERWIDKRVSERSAKHDDIEAFLYPETLCLGIQGHPEYRGVSRFTGWCLQQIEDKIKHNHHVKNENGVIRIQKKIEIV